MLSICGVNCQTDCKAYKTECEGCNELQGHISWAVFYGRERCPIYDCALGKGFSSCAECDNRPCHVWYDTRNPEATDEEFEADINNRLNNLQKYKEEKS
jgi:hypothetical protein